MIKMNLTKLVDSLKMEQIDELSELIYARRSRWYRAIAKPLSLDEVQLFNHGYKLDAIKAYRNRMNCSLYEAKVAVDVWDSK